jgi:hypothetical protein
MELPLFRIGTVLVALSAMVEGLDALGGIDIESLVPASHDAARVVAAIGVVKIALRGLLVVVAALQPKDASE